jgi:hypothetical protein
MGECKKRGFEKNGMEEERAWLVWSQVAWCCGELLVLVVVVVYYYLLCVFAMIVYLITDRFGFHLFFNSNFWSF